MGTAEATLATRQGRLNSSSDVAVGGGYHQPAELEPYCQNRRQRIAGQFRPLMQLWSTSAVNERAQNGPFPRASGHIKISNKINDLMMAERVRFELSIWFCIESAEKAGKQPFIYKGPYCGECANAHLQQ